MDITEELLRGARGRGLCLEYARRVDEAIAAAPFTDVYEATIHARADEPSAAASAAAELIARTRNAPFSWQALRRSLGDTVDRASYWQEPDPEDVLAALPAVRESLVTVARRLAEEVPDLTAPAASEQYAVEWPAPEDIPPPESPPWGEDPAVDLARWTAAQRLEEETAKRERPSDPHARWSGTWWSVPPQLLETRRRALDALEFVEDSLGWETASVVPVRGTGRILEIDSADAWAALCREYPMEVTASRRHDWFRVTGRAGPWLIPDWERVAGRWDAVHLTLLAYLSSAGRTIDIDGEYATVIAGWGPDSTIWLADVARADTAQRSAWRSLADGRTWVAEASVS